MEQKKVNYPVFLEQLTLMFKELDLSDSIISSLNKTTDTKTFEKFLERYMGDICDDLNIVVSDEDTEWDLNKKIEDLEYEICELESQLEDNKLLEVKTLEDEYKSQILIDLYEKYSLIELEKLYIDGKKIV